MGMGSGYGAQCKTLLLAAGAEGQGGGVDHLSSAISLVSPQLLGLPSSLQLAAVRASWPLLGEDSEASLAVSGAKPFGLW